MAVVKPAEARIVDLLAASGVEVCTWRLPAELQETRFGPRINHDDLLDFHDLLDSDSWFDDLVQQVESDHGAALEQLLTEPEFDSER
jgi:hypothetical protein